MNYESMSDFEINKAAFILGIKLGLTDCEDLMQNKNTSRNGVMYADGANWHEWDGCNNPSDTWPIIELTFKSGVTLIVNDSGVTTSNLGEKYNGRSIEVNCKPLRAAMIVFLMMNENK